MQRQYLLAAAAAGLLVSTAAAAQNEIGYPEGSLGYAAIMNSDYTTAERQLNSDRVSASDPARLINYGFVLAKTGRTQEAAEQFKRVLNEEDVELVTADGQSQMAHYVARRALAALSGR